MPSDRDFKQLVRARMVKTGESYSIARMHMMRTGQGSGTPAERVSTAIPVGGAIVLGGGGPGDIYQLKVSIDQISPPIWRRLQVPADITLDQLAGVLLAAVGWHNSHLHQFTIDGVLFGDPEDEYLDDGMPNVRDERHVTLRRLADAGTRSFGFLYDFGDHWQHTIEIESVDVSPSPGVSYPTCIAGERACPPEDCGGTGGYSNMLEILRDRAHLEYREMKVWVGRKYDAERFDVLDANKTLRRLQRRRGSGRLHAYLPA